MIDTGKQKVQRLYFSPCLAWKWYAFFFQAAFIYEVIVVAFYWIMLFPTMSKNKPTHILALEYADHIFPMFCLLFDYIFLGSTPFVRRHFPFIILMCLCYLVFNCIYTLNYGPIYPPITWKGFLGFAIPFGLVLAGIIFCFVMEFLTKLKLKA